MARKKASRGSKTNDRESAEEVPIEPKATGHESAEEVPLETRADSLEDSIHAVRAQVHPDLQVSLENLRQAFHWLSLHSWPFMEATQHHACWQEGLLDEGLEALLQEYAHSTGSTAGGVPAS